MEIKRDLYLNRLINRKENRSITHFSVFTKSSSNGYSRLDQSEFKCYYIFWTFI